MQSLKDGKIRPSDIQVKIKSGQCNISEAIQDGILDKATGIYTSPESEKMSLIEAIRAEYIFIVSAPGVSAERPKSIHLNGKSSLPTIRDGTIKARIVESGVTTTRISTFMVQVPGTGEEISLEEAVKRGIITAETAAQMGSSTASVHSVDNLN